MKILFLLSLLMEKKIAAKFVAGQSIWKFNANDRESTKLYIWDEKADEAVLDKAILSDIVANNLNTPIDKIKFRSQSPNFYVKLPKKKLRLEWKYGELNDQSGGDDLKELLTRTKEGKWEHRAGIYQLFNEAGLFSD